MRRIPPIPRCRPARTWQPRFPSRSSSRIRSRSRRDHIDTSDPWSPKDWLRTLQAGQFQHRTLVAPGPGGGRA